MLPCSFPRPWRLADLHHQFVERGVVASGEGEKGIGPLKDSPLDRLRNALSQEQEFALVGVKGIGESVDQGVGWVVAEVQPLVLDPAQVGKADIDLLGQITQAPPFCVPKLSNPFPERRHKVAPGWRLLVAAYPRIS